MCGIVGVSKSGMGLVTTAEQMLERLVHRGPDGKGVYGDSCFALGSRRLSIVDVANGAQPVRRQYHGKDFVGVINGEIYNFQDIKTELESIGLKFVSNCDSEVAIAAYSVWGPSCVERFDGQWAMAVWGITDKMLFLTRDPFGIKPLYYFSEGDLFAFASEPKALFAHSEIQKLPNRDAILEYFLHGYAFASGYCLNHRSFYERVHSLPPGHSLLWHHGAAVALEIRKYFDPMELVGDNQCSRSEAVDHVRESLESNIRACLMGDVPSAVALSGGLDSSIIATMAARYTKGMGRQPLLASTILYEGQHQNEDAAHALEVSEYAPDTAPMHLIYSRLSVECYLDDLDRMIAHFDEPHWELKQLAMFANYGALSSAGAKVVLTGEGADELFFGYFHKFPGFKSPVFNSADDLVRFWSRRVENASRLFNGNVTEQMNELLNEAIDRHYRPASECGIPPQKCMQLWYFATFLHWLLIDNDRCSMAFSIEGRFPFLNKSVYSVALSMPADYNIGGSHGDEKLVLREAFSKVLPKSVWKDRKKSPLPSPLGLSFHRKIARALVQSIKEVPRSIWAILEQEAALALADAFVSSIEMASSTRGEQRGGELLTSYLSLADKWEVRAPHAFALLTLLRWWKLNFSD